MGAETICAFGDCHNGRCLALARARAKASELLTQAQTKQIDPSLIFKVQGAAARVPTHAKPVDGFEGACRCKDIVPGAKVDKAVGQAQRGCNSFDDGRTPNGLAQILGKR